jgi:hypothetical protein
VEILTVFRDTTIYRLGVFEKQVWKTIYCFEETVKNYVSRNLYHVWLFLAHRTWKINYLSYRYEISSVYSIFYDNKRSAFHYIYNEIHISGAEKTVVFKNSWLKQYQGDFLFTRKIKFDYKMFPLYSFILSSAQK